MLHRSRPALAAIVDLRAVVPAASNLAHGNGWVVGGWPASGDRWCWRQDAAPPGPFEGPPRCTSGTERDPNESEAPEMNPGFSVHLLSHHVECGDRRG